MSGPRAIEAVTETLRSLVDIGIKEVEGSAVAVTRPPDRVGDTAFDKQVNLFLYQAVVDGALRNQPPSDLLAGETGDPALPLVLHYLLTPHVSDGNDVDAHRMLGGALRILHEHAVLTRAELAEVAPYSDISSQVERVRITWQPQDEKEIYSLWSVFQTPYRLSAAFEVRVVLIDSRTQRRAPLPVLRRGEDDQGPVAQGSPDSPFPSLASAVPPAGRSAAGLGEQVVLQGTHLLAPVVSVRLTHPLLPEPLDVPALEVAGERILFRVPDDPAAVPAGMWSVSVVHGGPRPDELPTNGIPLLIAPRITSAMPMTVARNGAGTAVVTLTCEPLVRPQQAYALLLGGRSTAGGPVADATDSLTFRVPSATPGTHVVRLRVAGTDSPAFDRSVTPPVLVPSQTLTVT